MRREDIIGMFKKMPILMGDNVYLREMRPSDNLDMFEYAQSEEVTKYLLWSPHKDSDYTREYLKYIGKHYKAGDFFDWAIILKGEEKMIGTCGFARFDYNNDSGEIGYVLNPKYQGRGLATEAVTLVIGFGFINLGLNRIEARYMPENIRSRKLMERVGMQYEGTARELLYVKGSHRDIATCAVLRKDYLFS